MIIGILLIAAGAYIAYASFTSTASEGFFANKAAAIPVAMALVLLGLWLAFG